MSLCNYYNNLVKDGSIEHDGYQYSALQNLEEILIKLESGTSGPLSRLKNLLISMYYGNNVYTKTYGLYLYSTVGRGKTMLMDLFYQKLNIDKNQKYRTHFHHFMKSIHNKLQQVSGIQEPVEHVIKTYYLQYKVICLDEFMVHDIADAMILAKVLEYLVKYDIALITTSNVKPDDLYKNGLQRSSFLPAIDIINSKLSVCRLEGEYDYRKSMLMTEQMFLLNTDSSAKEKFTKLYNKLSNVNIDVLLEKKNTTYSNQLTKSSDSIIEIAGRNINVLAVNDYTVWFDFDVLCNSARSSIDYLEIAEIYKYVFISNLYQMHDRHIEIVRRFINLIDVLYDYKVKLFVMSSVSIENIYTDKTLAFEMQRTVSRLKEMQSDEYLDEVHL